MKNKIATDEDYKNIGLKKTGDHKRVLVKIDKRTWFEKLFNLEGTTEYVWKFPHELNQ